MTPRQYKLKTHKYKTSKELLWPNNFPHCETPRKDNRKQKPHGYLKCQGSTEWEKFENGLNSSNIRVLSGTATCAYLRPGIDNHYKGDAHHSVMIPLMVELPYYKLIIMWPESVAGV